MEEKTLDDEQYGSEEQQETKGFGDSTECGWMQGILGLSGSGDRCLEGGPRVEAIFDVSSWQMPAGQAGAANTVVAIGFSWTTLMLCTRVPKLHVPAAELWKELVLDMHGTCHLDKHGRMCM